jgi:epoxyqueuosine reductase
MAWPGAQRRIAERARELGFATVGFVPAGPLDHAPHLHRWLEDGYAGAMEWMGRHEALRADSAALLPGARTVIALSAAYEAPSEQGGIAGYALGMDYHDVLRARLRQLAAFVRMETGADVQDRPVVDSAPMLERNVAVDAGLGWLGKSAMVIHPRLGTYSLLAELVVDVDLADPPPPQPDRCGRCTRCLDLCPTGAIVAPYRVDARRCISYWTIEVKGPIPRPMRPLIGGHLFGCDLCQQVCPWNRKADPGEVIADLRPRAALQGLDARTVLAMDPGALRQVLKGTPLERTRARGLQRNATVVLGNAPVDGAHAVLAQALALHPEPLVRGHAAWALGRLGGLDARAALDAARARDEDPLVREEVEAALG